MPRSMIFGLIIGALVVAALAPTLVVGETPVGSNADTRVTLAFTAKTEALQQWLTGPWKVEPVGAGPSKGANVSLVFVDQHLVVDPDGKPAGTGTNRILALVVPGKHSGTGETAPVVARLYTADAYYVPGPYKNAVPATMKRERTIRESNTEPASGREMWSFRDGAGGTVELQFDYRGALPAKSKSETKVYSAQEPSFYRIYRVEQGTDVVKSVPAGIDRVQNYQLTIGIPELRKIFDGSEQLVSIAVIPWYVRQTSLP